MWTILKIANFHLSIGTYILILPLCCMYLHHFTFLTTLGFKRASVEQMKFWQLVFIISIFYIY